MRYSRRWYAVAVLCGLAVMSYVDRLALSLLVQPIKADLGIDDAQVGLLLGPSFALFYAGMALPLAWIIDRSNRIAILSAAVALWSVATCGGAFATGFGELALSRIGVGIGEAALTPAVVSLIGDLFDRDRRAAPVAAVTAAQALGGTAAFLMVGALLAVTSQTTFAPVAALVGATPWRMTLFMTGLPGLVLALVLFLSVAEPARSETTAPGSVGVPPGPAAGSFADNAQAARFFVPFLLGSNLLVTPLFLAVMWLPTRLIRDFGLDPARTGFIFGMLTLFGVAGALCVPLLAQRLVLAGRRDIILRLMTGLLPIAGLFFLIACLAPSLPVTLVAIALFQFTCTGVGVFPSAVIAALAAPRTRGRFAAVHLIFQALIPSSVAPYLVGRLSADAFGGRVGEALACVVAVALPAAFLLLWRCRPAYRAAVAVR